MADLSRGVVGVTFLAAHGKEGVNGSSPLEGLRFSAWLSGIDWRRRYQRHDANTLGASAERQLSNPVPPLPAGSNTGF